MRKCEYCGAWLDANETCTCKNGTDDFKPATLIKRPITKEELKAKLERMSNKEYTEYCKRFIVV